MDKLKKAPSLVSTTNSSEQMHDTLGRLGKYIAAQSSAPASSHKLSIETVDDRFSWIMDGSMHVALLDKEMYWLDVWHGIAEPLAPPTIPKHYHAPTQMGARLTLTLWKQNTPGHTFSNSKKLETSLADDGSILIRVDEQYDKATAWREVCVFWSDELNRYFVDIVGEMEGELPQGRTTLEFLNIYPYGIFDDRAASKRYQRTYFSGPSCGQVTFAQNPLTPYLTSEPCVEGMNLPYEDLFYLDQGDYFGFGIETGFNPFLMIANDSAAIERATCCCLQDEHFYVKEDALDSADKIRCHFVFSYLKDDEAKQLDTDSELLTFEKGYPELPAFPPDDDGVMRPIDPTKTQVRSLWWHGKYARNLHYEPNSGPANRGEIILQGPGRDYSIFAYPAGTSLHLTPGKKHTVKLSIKVEGDNTFGQAIATQYLFSNNNPLASESSNTFIDDDQWHPVILEFYPEGECAFWNLNLKVTGHGRVRFSDFDYCVEE